jgi:hypothetical protein
MEVMASSARIAEGEPNKRGQVPRRIDVDGIPEETCRRWIAARPARGESAVSDEPAQTLEARRIAFLAARTDEDEARANAMEHFTVHDDTYLSCPATRTEPYGDLPWGEESCDCGLAPRKARALREVQAKREILDLYTSTLALVQEPLVMTGGPYAGKINARDYEQALRELAVLRPVILVQASIYSDHPDCDPRWRR